MICYKNQEVTKRNFKNKNYIKKFYLIGDQANV